MTKRKKEWFDNDSFWRTLYPVFFTAKRIAEGAKVARGVLRLTKPKGKKVLDLCCGGGRCSVPIAKRGYQVTGVDRSAFMLSQARAAAKKDKAKIELIHKDMRDFVRPDSYDLVINIFTSFGYFQDKREDLLVLKNIYTSLRPGGACVIDVIGKERLAKIFDPLTVDIEPDGTILIQRHELLDDWTRIGNEWIFIHRGKIKRFKFVHTVYSGQELKDRLELAGFVSVKLFGSFEGEPYGLKSLRLIAVARKPVKATKRRNPQLALGTLRS